MCNVVKKTVFRAVKKQNRNFETFQMHLREALHFALIAYIIEVFISLIPVTILAERFLITEITNNKVIAEISTFNLKF